MLAQIPEEYYEVRKYETAETVTHVTEFMTVELDKASGNVSVRPTALCDIYGEETRVLYQILQTIYS